MADESSQGRPQTRRRLAPRSNVWRHFTPVTDDHGNVVKGRCNRCRKELVSTHGTTSLRKHVDICSRLGRLEEPTKHLARMIALRGHDSSLVEDDCFRSFVGSLNPEYKVPSRVDIEETCNWIYHETRRDLLSRLRRATGQISLAVGTVRTMDGKVRYSVCHFIDDEWNLHKVVLDAHFFHFDIPSQIVGDFLRYDFSDRLFMMACDTTSCGIEGVLICTTDMDHMLRSIARSFTPDKYFIDHLHSGFHKISLTKQERLDFEVDYHQWAQGEHWHWWYCSLEVRRKEGGNLDVLEELLCRIWGGINRAIRSISVSTCPSSQHLCLAELLMVREIFQSELARASGGHAHIYEKYKGCFHGKEMSDVLREAKGTLDKGIQEQDSYLVWSIPLVLDPRYKLKYIEFSFKRAFGSEAATKMIVDVTTKIKELYTDHTGFGGGDSDQLNAMTAHSSDPLEQAWDEHCRLQLPNDVVAVDDHLQDKTELDYYLEDHLVPRTEGFDILNWWKVHSREYPTVARMARNAFAMPASSKLSSEQIAHVRSLVLSYSTEEEEE